MKKLFLLALILIIGFQTSLTAQSVFNDPLAHTYSIVARDKTTGEMAVGVQSHWFSVGTIVSWGKSGTGVVATQSFVNPSFGPNGIKHMLEGKDAEETLNILIEGDEGRDFRQVAVLDVTGKVAAYTGKKCIISAHHITGDNYSVQANMMLNDQVVPAMEKAYKSAKDSFADRLLKTLEAAEEAGGDIRGRQSAAISIVKGDSSGRPWADKVIDLRVEDHQEPLQELRRLVKLHKAYQHMNNGDVAIEENDFERAAAEYSAAAALAPNNLEVVYWQAITLATGGKVEQAKPLLCRVFSADPNWIELTRRLFKPGIIPDTAEGHALVESIVGACRH